VHVIAGASPDNTPAGDYWTFLFPMLLFIVIALILWALFGRPHQRVPSRRLRFGLSSATAGHAGAAAVAAGPAGASGGGAHLTASVEPEPEPAAEADDSSTEQPPADGAGAGE
jgi:hypothetical protein